MYKKHQPTNSQLRAEAEMAERREQRLDEQGLCYFCGERPKNPFVDANACLDCYNKHPRGTCTVEGCHNSSAARYEQMPLCNVHLADTLHKEYKRYLSIKDELNDKEEQLGFEMIKEDCETNSNPEEDIELPDSMVSLNNEIKMIQRELGILKSAIKDANKEVGGVFPENYEIFG